MEDIEQKEEMWSSSSPSHKVILWGLIIIILFLDSLLVIASAIKRGFLKKEVLSENSNFGFDFKIIMKQ